MTKQQGQRGRSHAGESEETSLSTHSHGGAEPHESDAKLGRCLPGLRSNIARIIAVVYSSANKNTQYTAGQYTTEVHGHSKEAEERKEGMTLIEADNLEPTEPLAERRTFQAASTAVDLLTTKHLLHAVEKAIADDSKRCVIFCNVSTVVSCRHDAALRNAVDSAEVVSPDGMPLVWLARLQGHRIERVDGPSFMKTAMANGVPQGWRHYLYGGSPGVLARLIENLERDLPGVRICGTCSPPFRELTDIEEVAMVDEINSAAPDLVWVGLGMPKQELWMARNRDRISAPVLLGVGAAFDFHAGARKRAPKWMQQSGLEWLHRLVHEPRRLGRRYVAGNARFLMLVTREELQRRLAAMREAS